MLVESLITRTSSSVVVLGTPAAYSLTKPPPSNPSKRKKIKYNSLALIQRNETLPSTKNLTTKLK